MWSREELTKGMEACSIIFAALDAKLVENKLDTNQARAKLSKAVWLIRDSSIPDLLVVSYFDQKKQQYTHIDIGRVKGSWGFAPTTDTDAQAFKRQVEASFKENVIEDGAVKLAHFLAEYDFDLTKILKPKPIEATQNLQYVNYSMLNEEMTQESCEVY